MSEKKMVRRSVAIALGIICIVLIGGAMMYTVALLNDKYNKIDSFGTQISTLKSNISSLSSEISQLNATILRLLGLRANNANDSYTIWRADQYYATNDWSGMTDYSNGNFTEVFDQVLNGMPPSGGIIHLRQGYYEGWLVINRSGIVIKGEGASNNIPVGLPDDTPTSLTGTVLKVNMPNRDATLLVGQLNGIQISDLGIWFTVPDTGNGISDSMGQNFHLSYSSFQNIRILDHDKHHYAIQLSNFLHLDIKEIWAWGGPLLNLYDNKELFQSGNSNFYNIYSYIKYDLGQIDYVNGPYPLFIHKNNSLNSVWVNLLHLYRIQINCPFYQSDPNFYVATFWDCRYSTVDGLDLEGSGNGFEGHRIQMGSCYKMNFINAFIWSLSNNVYVNVAENNNGNTFDGCQIAMGTVFDASPTDQWIFCSIDGQINEYSKASFIDLPGNSGSAILEAGSIELNVTAKFIGPDRQVLIQPFPNATSQTIQGIRIKAIYSSPINNFTVTTEDGNSTSQDIGFWWWIP